MGARSDHERQGKFAASGVISMGMDSVELVLEFENEFEIQIPDEDAEKLLRVGDVVNYVVQRLKAPAAEEKIVSGIRQRVYCIVAEQMGIDIDQIMDSSRFVEDLGVT